MTAALWLAWQEICARKRSAVIGLALVTAAVTVAASVELVARAREAAVSAQVDHIGPPLRILPPGVTGRHLARYRLGPQTLQPDTAARLRRDLSPWTRAIDERLVQRRSVRGADTALIGVDPRLVVSPLGALAALAADDVAAGAEAARTLGLRQGERLALGGKVFRVAGILPTTGSADDTALFIPLGALQQLAGLAGRVNELRVYPRNQQAHGRIAAYLAARHAALGVVSSRRSAVADRELGQSLDRHRRALHLALALVLAICMLAWAQLNAGERRAELATLVVLGGRGGTVFAVLMLRATLTALVGALAGYAAGAAVALTVAPEAVALTVWSPRLLLELAGLAVAPSVLGTLPVALISAAREQTTAIQEAQAQG